MTTEPQIAVFPLSHIVRPYQNTAKSPQSDGKEVAAIPAAAVPPGHSLESVKWLFDEWRDRPERRTGTIRLRSFSLGSYCRRYRNDDTTVIFVQRAIFALYRVTVVFNYHPKGPVDADTGFGDFRATAWVWGKGWLDKIVADIGTPLFWGRP